MSTNHYRLDMKVATARRALSKARTALEAMEYVLRNWEADKAYVDNADVLRWRSNNHVPPTEILQAALDLELITLPQFNKSTAWGKVEAAEAIEHYKAFQAAHPPTEEELADMRANFGPGEVVVDVISGRRIQL